MRSEELKKEFIDTQIPETNRVNVWKLFNKISNYEDMLQKDIYTFTTYEIIDFYKLLYSTSLEYLKILNLTFGNYTRFVLSKHIVKDGQNHFEEIDADILLTCLNLRVINSKIIKYDDLISGIEQFNNASDKLLVLGLFEGIGGTGFKDFLNLTLDNFKGNKVILGDRSFEVSDRLLKYAQEAAEETEYYIYVSSDQAKFDKRKLIPSKKLIKEKIGMDTNPTPQRAQIRLYTRLIILQKYFGIPAYNQKGLKESGRIHMIKQIMVNENINLETAIRKHMNKEDEMVIRYGNITNNSVPAYLKKYQKYYEEE